MLVNFSFLSILYSNVLPIIGVTVMPRFNLCNIRQSLIEEELEKVHYAIESFTEEEVQNSIDKLNTNKSSDEYGISAEHLKTAIDI
jgi:hypothetical protein